MKITLKKLFILLVFFTSFYLFFKTIYFYEGNKPIYIFFTLVSFIYPLHAILRKTFFLDTFLSIFIWLGFWFKFSVSVAFYNSSFPEGVGMFDYSAASYDKVLVLSSFAIFLLIIFSFFANYFCQYKTNLIRKKSAISTFYKNHKINIIILFLSITLIINFFNYHFHVHQKGMVATSDIPLFIELLTKWSLMIGLPCFGLMILSIELYTIRNISLRTYLIVLIGSFISNLSMMSRGMMFNSAFILYGLWRTKNKLLRKKMFIFIVLLFSVAAASIFASYNLRLKNFYVTDLQSNFSQVTQKSNYESKKFFKEFIHLVRSRFVGVDSLMAVMSHGNLSNKILVEALNEKIDYQKYNFYLREFQRNRGDPLTYDEKYLQDNVYIISLPGFISFSYYSGSIFLMGILLLLFYIICVLIEYFSFKLSRKNIVYTSFVAGLLAYRLMHFGYNPQNSIFFIMGIFLCSFLIYIFEVYLIKFQKKIK